MQYIYIHGFGTTGAGSTKFKKIKEHAEKYENTAIALEWNERQTDIIEQLLKQLQLQVDWNRPLCFIGSSTGGNFTYQLLKKLAYKNTIIPFVLINPLLNIEQRKIDNLDFPLQLADQLKNPSNDLNNGLILLGKKDEVLDPEYSFIRLNKNNKIIMGEDWDHTLSNMDTQEFVDLIDLVVQNKVINKKQE